MFAYLSLFVLTFGLKGACDVIKTTPTMQTVVNPKLRPGEIVRENAYTAFTSLSPEYPRFVPWFPYPKLVVAELDPPTNTTTSWNFTLIDPLVTDFLNATRGRKPVINFSTIPAWMFQTASPTVYPDDPNMVDFDYNQGTVLLDPTGNQAGEYFSRVVSWYTKGGFTDELGVFHKSDHSYDLPFWEVLNEVDAEHTTTVEDYTVRYDAIVKAIRAVSPDTQFVSLALAHPSGTGVDYFRYFLNASNHEEGIPLDWISYHFYAQPAANETATDWQFTFFTQADAFVETIETIESIRKDLSPQTQTMLNEIGVILPVGNDAQPNDTVILAPEYWNAAGALYAYVYMAAVKLDIAVVGESQLVGFPSQFPSVTMVDWDTGEPNSRFRCLELLHQNIGPGDETSETVVSAPDSVVHLSYVRNDTKVNKVFLVNKLFNATTVDIFGAAGGVLNIVDTVSGNSTRQENLTSSTVNLGPFAVAIVDLPSV